MRLHKNHRPCSLWCLLGSRVAALFILVLGSSHFTLAQTNEEQKEVEILNADELRFQELEGRKITRMVGNVRLKQEEIYMWCDSAHLYKETNTVDAWGNVHIQQDTVHAYSRTLHHDGNRKFSVLKGNARLSNGRMTLTTEQLFYDVKNRVSFYTDSGTVKKDSTIITSRKGYYHTNTSDVYFKEQVVVRDSDYTIHSDTLKYHTGSKITTFLGLTEILRSENRIVCYYGWFDSENDISSFGKNTVVYNPPQRLVADSIYYERNRGFSKVIGPFQWTDSTMGTEIFGRYAEYSDRKQYLMATQQPLLIYKMENDSLFLVADTLKSMNKSEEDTTRVFYAYHHVRMYMKEMQGACDSLFYSFEDSTFRMYHQPVIWSDRIQMSGDTIYLVTRNKKAERFSIHRSGFIISPSGKKFYDQIKGINIFGYLVDNEIKRLDVVGNSETLYFGKDDLDKFIGANTATSEKVSLHFHNKKIEKIVFIQKPDAVFTPIKMLAKDQLQLKGFYWQIDRKPKSREDLWP